MPMALRASRIHLRIHTPYDLMDGRMKEFLTDLSDSLAVTAHSSLAAPDSTLWRTPLGLSVIGARTV